MMGGQIVWVDIPVKDLKRATSFYENVLDTFLEPIPGMNAAVFKHSDNDVSGCLVEDKGFKPSEHGPLVYLNTDNRLDEAIALVSQHGGKVIEARHAIGPYGFRSIVLDSEGNKVALYSKK
jgi:uncharacterized protein